jgi:hypothetical protein
LRGEYDILLDFARNWAQMHETRSGYPYQQWHLPSCVDEYTDATELMLALLDGKGLL